MNSRVRELDRWASAVDIRARYRRSINLERDANEATWLDDYLLTPLVRSTALRIASCLGVSGQSRAWSITGPYGSGKSAFALFLSRVLGTPNTAIVKAARKMVAKSDPLLDSALFASGSVLTRSTGLLPVLATGERDRLETILLAALKDALARTFERPGAKPDVFRSVVDLANRSRLGRTVSSKEVANLFALAAEKVANSGGAARGLLVVLDEAGKALEYAAHDPGKADVQLLQELAEVARTTQVPLVFVVSLHQSFDTYASRLSTAQRTEWQKIQGRFEDVAFQESSEHILQMIGAAIQRGALDEPLKRNAVASIARVVAAVRTSNDAEKERLSQQLEQAIPLHPTTALVLGPLFRSRLSQNERSLFAFLSSGEPFGFQDFVRTEGVPQMPLPFYSLDRLYDYVMQAIGMGVYGHHGRCWAQVKETLARLPDTATQLDERIVKVVGLLSAVGDAAGLVASEDIIAAALTDGSGSAQREISESLARLKDHSLIVFRKYRGAYQLWDGSDLDIDALVSRAFGQLEIKGRLVDRISRVVAPRPLVARRHFFETGTLRYFTLKYADETILDKEPLHGGADGDGIVWLLVPSGPMDQRILDQRLRNEAQWDSAKDARPVLVVVPNDATHLREFATEVAALEKVSAETPQLQSDPVARRELSARLLEAERLLAREVTQLTTGAKHATWYSRNGAISIRTARELTTLISDICEAAYSKAPYIRNELINRSTLSSAAAAARRDLLQAMVEKRNEKRLGLEGYPPEVSIYRSVLVEHGLHIETEKGWQFTAPNHRRPGSLAHAYKALYVTLHEREDQKVGVESLYERLRRPPYGVKDGVLPILLAACLLEHQQELALYEDGVFVPSLTVAPVERLLRSPEKFAVQLARIQGGRSDLLHRLGKNEAGLGNDSTGGLLPVVRQLVRIANELPEYSRNTRRISTSAQAVREALLRAREPGPLIFKLLPEACGFESVLPNPLPKETADLLLAKVEAALRELREAYPSLLQYFEKELFNCLGVTGNSNAARREVGIRAKRLLPVCVDPELKAFLLRASEETLEREEWLVSISTMLGGKPPHAWHDRDLDQIPLTLGAIARRFKNLEAVSLDHAGEEPLAGGISLIRVSVAQAATLERASVVTVRASDQPLLEAFCGRIRAEAASAASDLSMDIVLAGLAIVSRELMTQVEDASDRRIEADA